MGKSHCLDHDVYKESCYDCIQAEYVSNMCSCPEACKIHPPEDNPGLFATEMAQMHARWESLRE